MLTEPHLFDEPHYFSLELLALQALVSGDIFTAFKFADRRCRIAPPPKSHSYLLRGEALFRMGDRAAAMADLFSAKHLAPEDIAVNRRILARAKGSAQSEAALALVRRERNLDVLRQAIEALRASGRSHIANAVVYDDTVGGWAVWQTDAPLEIMVTDGSNKLMALVDRDPVHPFSDLGNAADFEVRRPRSSVPHSITLSVGGEVIYHARAPGNEARRDDKLSRSATNRTSREAKSVTVIVPVFADFASTHVCVESLLAQDTSSVRIILVNDATPYPRIAKYLKKCAKHPSVLLLENETNLGYVGSINRALEHVEANDILLLNSDTIGPKNFIERLRVAAASEPAVGTVTPLSNNGEYMSFPVANKPNPPASPDDLSELDAVAAKVNAERLVDIPNGIGFCLYITQACFDAVGPLSEDYVRGYLEDADFCLRARARGFRNVCAPSIYVGHVGTRSFGADKRALVMRNLDVLERRFPSYQYQSAAFVLADPLAPSRQAIEREIPPRATGLRLLITGAGDISVVARERARRLGLSNQVAIILEFHNDAGGSRVKMFNPAGGIPQSVEYVLSSATECEAMIDYIRAMHPGALEILDPTSVPLTIMDRILNLGFPHDIFVADDAFLGARSSSLAAAGSHQPARSTAFNDERRLSRRWLDIARAAERVIVPSEQAYACARKSFPASKLMRGKPFIDAGRKNSRRRTQPVSRLGILSVHGSGKEHALIGAVARALSLSALEVAITVIGSTLDDIALMQNCRTFVTGAINPEDFSWVMKSYGLQALFMPLTRPLFGHPLCEVGLTANLPVAFFDWSSRRVKPRENDLALDPLISFDDLIGRLSRWLSQPYDA